MEKDRKPLLCFQVESLSVRVQKEENLEYYSPSASRGQKRDSEPGFIPVEQRGLVERVKSHCLRHSSRNQLPIIFVNTLCFFHTVNNFPIRFLSITCAVLNLLLFFRKITRRSCQCITGSYEVKGQGRRWYHHGQQSRRVGGEVDLHIHALGSCKGWQAALGN